MIQPDPLFIDEALVNLDAMDRLLRGTPQASMAAEDIDALFRAAHSVKGGAAAFGLAAISGLMHQAEFLLDHWRKRRLVPTSATRGLLRSAVALARSSLVGGGQEGAVLGALTAQLVAAGAACESIATSRMVRIRIAHPYRGDLDDAVAGLFRDVAGLGQIVAMSHDLVGARVFEVLTGVVEQELIDLLALHVERADITVHVLSSAAQEPAGMAELASDPNALPSVRVSLEELDALGSLARKLVRTSTTLRDATMSEASVPATLAVAGVAQELRDLVTRIDQLVQQMRTAPVAVLFALLPPLLDRLSGQLGKSFGLATSGDTLRLSRHAIQGLADPLIQLIRNACDHGIEPAAQRIAAGKPAQGRITVSAVLRGDAFGLAVHDDGRGLSRTRLLQVARERGLDVSDATPDAALWQMVFLPGFSTASNMTSVSGRGVGMDLVKHKLDSLGGRVSIDSGPTRGTTVMLELPIDSALGERAQA